LALINKTIHNEKTWTYTGCLLKKVGAMVGAWKNSRRTKKFYTILPISQ